jgi:predicted anti-sigma-YlaC factor YlaD
MRMPFMASCEETRRLLSDYVEDELAEPLRGRVARHLRMCRRCRAVWQALVATMGGLHCLGTLKPAPQPALADTVVERIRTEESDRSY